MKIWKNDCLWKLPSLSTVLKIRHGFRKNPLHGFSSFVLIVSGNILIPNFDPLAWPSSAPACYIQMLLMFTQHSPQSKQSAQLCNMTRVATRSRLEGGPNRFRLGSFSRAIILKFALLYNMAAFWWSRVSYQLEHQLILWSTITRAVTEESNGQHSDGIKQKRMKYNQ